MVPSFEASLLYLWVALLTIVVAYSMISVTLMFWHLYKVYQEKVDLLCAAFPLLVLGFWSWIVLFLR
jgi:hypothetical protein